MGVSVRRCLVRDHVGRGAVAESLSVVCPCACAYVCSRVPASVLVSPVPRAFFASGRLIVVVVPTQHLADRNIWLGRSAHAGGRIP